METLKKEIKKLLSQDLVLEIEFKDEVRKNLDSLGKEQLTKILETLQILLNEEQEVIAHILETKPYFFIEVQHEILNVMHAEFEKEELVYRKQADTDLQKDLSNL